MRLQSIVMPFRPQGRNWQKCSTTVAASCHCAGSSRPGYSLAEAEEPNFIPGVAAASLVQRQPPKPAGPPKRWPHTSNYNVPPQGRDDV